MARLKEPEDKGPIPPRAEERLLGSRIRIENKETTIKPQRPPVREPHFPQPQAPRQIVEVGGREDAPESVDLPPVPQVMQVGIARPAVSLNAMRPACELIPGEVWNLRKFAVAVVPDVGYEGNMIIRMELPPEISTPAPYYEDPNEARADGCGAWQLTTGEVVQRGTLIIKQQMGNAAGFQLRFRNSVSDTIEYQASWCGLGAIFAGGRSASQIPVGGTALHVQHGPEDRGELEFDDEHVITGLYTEMQPHRIESHVPFAIFDVMLMRIYEVGPAPGYIPSRRLEYRIMRRA